MYHEIFCLILAIIFEKFFNSFCIFFAFLIFSDIIQNCFSLFFFNYYHFYLIIIFYLLVYNILILNKFFQYIQIFFTLLKSSSVAFILPFHCKSTFIFYNHLIVDCVKPQALLFYAKLSFCIQQTIIIFFKYIEQKKPIAIYSN